MKTILLNFSIWRLEVLAGVFLGMGFLTKLRIWGSVGVPEILAGIFLILAAIKYLKNSLDIKSDLYSILKLVFIFLVFIGLPINTYLTYASLHLEVSVRDIFIYYGCAIFGLVLLEAQKDFFNFELLTITMAITISVCLLFSIIFLPIDFLFYETVRFSGGATNPNQFTLYCLCLMFLAASFTKKNTLKYIFFGSFVLGWYTYSYAFLLSVFTIALFFAGFKYFEIKNKKAKYFISIVIVIFICSFIFIQNKTLEAIISFWNSSDDVSVRLGLLKNSLFVVFQHPLFGLGAGYFSGIVKPFQGMDAHNTFLDFSIIFGLPFAILIYGIIFAFLYQSFWFKNKLIACTTVGLIVFSMFHFIGRHFIFWFIIAIMVYQLLNNSMNNDNQKNSVLT